jgi:ABC-type multidrug transport system fused ATPase/permease subunit
VELNPNLSAVIAFLAVLATETVRWRSDCWKSEGEAALRKWEMADGLGVAVDRTYIADWLAAKPKGFLADVIDTDVQGSEFDSGQTRGPLRVVKNTQESAWWSKHLSNRMVVYLSVVLLLIIVAAFIALTLCIASLKNASAQPSITVVQNVGGILCSVLIFVFSINIVRLLMEFWTFAAEAKEILNRCAGLLGKSELAERDALSVLHDYQTARSSAPLLPTFVWKFHCNHLREQWADFRQEPGS